MIKAVVFDFDGLIIDTETVWYEAYKEVFQEHDLHLPMDEFLKCIGTDIDFLAEYFQGEIDAKEKRAAITAKAAEKHTKKMKWVNTRGGVREYLAEAKQLGLRIGLASSSSKDWVEGFLKQLDILHYFEVIRTREDVTKVKPDPALYLSAIEALEVKSYEAVAFEDSANGAKAAKDAGLKCVIVPNEVTKSLEFVEVDLRIGSMDEVGLRHVIGRISE
ncbi:HAD family hydrolase [Ammoniphilus sp. YIM 78166]|uniref:HAD family hydrolase n=1 Tax=Ammoniphilus sp. YIM 78166 TaxID=1644106 RepID=UPI00106FCB49|nr:HAD family hydrolase [Ammoniphilus sp. YIM 78166]